MVNPDENRECMDAGITMLHCGREECAPKHGFGPVMRDHYLIHYIENGKGIFEINNNVYRPNAGDIFFIMPNVITYYEADATEPWTYKWIGIKGRQLEHIFKTTGLSVKNPVMRVGKEVSLAIDEIINEFSSEKHSVLKLSSCAYNFLDKLVTSNPHKPLKKSAGQIYAEQAVDYIWQYIYRNITVEELAQLINIDRSYLASIFKEHTGLSPKKYIVDVKMNTACEYLLSTDYDITHIAQSVGYEDLFVFSHAFKNHFGISPKAYREKRLKNNIK